MASEDRAIPLAPGGPAASLVPHMTGSWGYGADVAADGSSFLTLSSVSRACRWSMASAERQHCVPASSNAAYFSPQQVWLYASTSDGERVGIWDLTNDQLAWHHYRAPHIEPSPVERRVLVARPITVDGVDEGNGPPADDRMGRVRISVHRWNETQAEWTATCPESSQPYWDSSGRWVVCDTTKPRNRIALDAATGREVTPFPEHADPYRNYDGGHPCGIQLGLVAGLPRDVTVLKAAGEQVAFVFDLDEHDWAIVLTDGRYKGSAGATDHLVFHDQSGARLTDSAVAALEDSAAVEHHLAALATCDER